MRQRTFWLIVLAVLASPRGSFAESRDRSRVIVLVEQIKRADYEGDRTALSRLYGALEPFAGDQDLSFSSRVLYWRGFALWRRAINGFNDGTGRDELRQDLQRAEVEFDTSSHRDPSFADAKVGTLGCMSLVGYLLLEDGATIRDSNTIVLLKRMRQLRSEIQALGADNPRLVWVIGPGVWKTPPEQGGGEAKAIDLYN